MTEEHKQADLSGGQFDNLAYIKTTEDLHVVTKSEEKLPDKVAVSPVQIDTRFGYGPCKPRCFQVFNKVGFLVAWLAIFCFLEGFAINGIANAGLPGIERQFQLTSSKSSLIPASQDIGALIVILFVSFIGGRYNKTCWIAGGSLIMALGSFVFIIPHLASPYDYQGRSGSSGPTDTCNGSTGGPPPCTDEGEKYVGVFMLSNIISGLGFTPMFTLGTVYLDENCNPSTAAVYVGLCYAATAVGVAAGFFAGGQVMQNYFVDFDRIDTDTLGFDAMDTRWVGAWWFGFVFTAVLFVIIALPIFGYPKYMPDNAKAQETEARLRSESDNSCGKMAVDVLKDFFRAFLRLAKNPTFMLISLAGCAVSLIIFGVSAFAFKFLSEMYNMGFDTAGVLLGALILVGSLGMFLGGMLIRVFRLEIVGMLRLCTGATFLACLLGLAYLAKCPELQLAGMEVSYPNESVITGYSAGCNNECGCEDMSFNPVCGDDHVVYYSACHAGCLGAPSAPMEPYTNCSCVATNLNISQDMSAKAKTGRCDDGCTNIYVLAPCLFIMMIAALTPTTPSSMATLRCVDDDIKPLSLGVSWVLLRLLGSIPGPVLIGSVIDSACELSSGGFCGGSGFCMLYSKNKLSMGVLLWWMLVCAVACVLFFIASLFAARLEKRQNTDLREKSSGKSVPA